MKKITMIIGLLVTASAVWGQSSFPFYVEVGTGTSRLYGRHSGSDAQTAYKAGIGAEYTLDRTWAPQSALEFILIGGKNNTQYVKYAGMYELCLRIPVMVAARLPLGENYHASLGLDPYIAYGINGKISGSIRQDYVHSGHDGYYRFWINTSGSVLGNKTGNRRLDGGIIIEVAFKYRWFIIDAEAQVGLVKVNQQLRQIIETGEL